MAFQLGVNPNHNGGIIYTFCGKVSGVGKLSFLHNDPDLDKRQKMDRWVAVIAQVYKGSNGSLFTCGLILI